MAGIELAQAWVTISPRTKGMQKEIDKQLKGIASKGEKTGSALGEKITSGLKKTAKVGALAAGGAAAAAFGTALKKGFDRLDAIEQAKVKFEALGYTAKQQTGLMDDVTAAVKGTAFSTSEAADAAAMALAGGIKPGKELTGVLKTIGDSASFANKSFADVAPIYTKAINSGRVMGDTLMQLEENAIPVTQALSQSMGKSTEEIRKMASEGKISFDDLQKAMDETIGGQALKAGDTFTGSLANIGAAWARLGETILSAPFNAAPAVFNNISDRIDVANDKLKGFLELFSTGEYTKEIGVNLAGGDEANALSENSALVTNILNFRDKSIEAIDAVKSRWDQFQRGFNGQATEGMFGRLGQHFGTLADAALRMATPLARVAASLGEAGMTASMVSLLGVLEAVTPLIDHILVPALEKLADIMVNNQGAVNAFVTAFVGFHTLKTANKGLTAFGDKAKGAYDAAKKGTSFVKNFGGALKDSWKYAGQAAPNVGTFGKASLLVKENAKAAGSALVKMNGPIGMAARGFRGLGLAIKANPIGAIVAGVVAAIAALTWFFTKTETGKKIWAKFMEFLRPVIDWMAQKFSELGGIVSNMWESYIKPALSAFATMAKWVAAIVLTILITPIMLAWKAMSAVFQWAWNTLIKPAWDAMKVAAQFLWNSVLKPVFDFIKGAWNLLALSMKAHWEGIIRPAWDALKIAAQFMWTYVLQPIFNHIKNGWNIMATGIKWIWENVIRVAWDALKTALQTLYNNVIKPTFQWIGDRWRDMSGVLSRVANWINDHVFGKIRTGLDWVKRGFSTAVDAIKNTWDRIGNIARKPVAFIVDTVFNNGIRKAWNAVAGFVGLDDKKLKPLGPVAQYAKGGVLPGYTPGRDVHAFYSPTGGQLALSGGEAIMRPEWTRAIGGPAAVEAMNRTARSGGVNAVRRQLGEGAGFHTGGVIAFKKGGTWDDKIRRTQAEARKHHGKPYQWGGVGNPSFDCSGLWSAITSHLNGGPFGGRLFTTHTFMGSTPPGWSPGLSGPVTVGVNSGHMAGTLGGINMESAGGGKGVQIGGSALGSDDRSFTKQFTLRDFVGEFISGGFGITGGGNPVAQLAKAAWDKVIDALPKFKEKVGPWAPVPGKFLKKAASTMWDWIKSKLPIGGGGSSDVDLSGVNGDTMAKVQEVFKRHGWTGQQWEDAKWIIGRESGWNTTATNPSSGAFGLFQFNPSSGTLQQYLPDRNPDAAVQANAGARYIKDRYGDPSAARRFWEANNWYDNGGYLQPGVTRVHNETGKPEPVFTNAQWQTLKKSILSNEQWAQVAKPMVGEIEKFANGIRVKQVDKPVEIDDPKAKGSKASAKDESDEKVAETTSEKEEVKPDEVGASIAAGLIEGQLEDVRNVFGLPALKEVPAVKAALEANKAVVEDGGESNPVADLLEAGWSGAILDTMRGGDVVPLALKSAEEMARTAPQLASAGMASIARATSGAPAAAASAAANPGQSVKIVVDSTQRAFSEYRKLQAKTSAGAKGVR